VRSPTLAELKRALARHRPKNLPVQSLMKQAAVAAILREPSPSAPELLFIRRATHESDPWSGHMAFPGGRVDPQDPSPLAAARRETLEEVGLELPAEAQVGELSRVLTAPRLPIPMVIHPYVFTVEDVPPFRTDPEEVAEALWVPLGFLAAPENRGTMKRTIKGVPLTFPCYDYQGRVIWGLTLRMVDELLGLVTNSEVHS
jgi:8-oxo-dGTP pyrophosphatase MutT (NUDIX family)